MSSGKALILVLCCLSCGQLLAAQSFVRAELYFIDWSVLTRASLSPEQVRRHPYISMRIEQQDRVSGLLKWLDIDALSPSTADDGPGDARLVVDLFDREGHRVTFYADRFSLMSEDGSRRRAIDRSFRESICSGTRLNNLVQSDRCAE
jgi:hypothetical protein